MTNISLIKSNQQNSCIELLFQPSNWCNRQWEDLTTFEGDYCCNLMRVIALVAFFVPLTIATIGAYLMKSIGISLKSCTNASTLQSDKKEETISPIPALSLNDEEAIPLFPALSLNDPETIPKMKEALTRDWEIMQDYQNNNGPIFHHTCYVIEHREFPGFFFKFKLNVNPHEYKASVDYARDVIKKNHLNFCHVPQTEIIKLDNGFELLVMEKVQGKDKEKAVTLNKAIFNQFAASPDLKEKWRLIFSQAAEFICLTGYCDTGWHNISLDSHKGLSFFDFEGCKISPESPSSKILLMSAIIAMIFKMAPPDFSDAIFDIAQKHGLDFDPELREWAKHYTLDFRPKYARWTPKHSINTYSTINMDKLRISSTEKTLIELLNGHIDTNRMKDLKRRQFKLTNPLKTLNATVDQFNAMIDNLKKQGAIFDCFGSDPYYLFF